MLWCTEGECQVEITLPDTVRFLQGPTPQGNSVGKLGNSRVTANQAQVVTLTAGSRRAAEYNSSSCAMRTNQQKDACMA
jgi:hypothetical protein